VLERNRCYIGLIAVLSAMAEQTGVLASQVEQGFGQHPDAEIYLSQPGLAIILGPGARRVHAMIWPWVR
jgi:hypothetical protein